MARFKDIRDKKTKDEQRLDKIENLIQNYEDNQAGPYWINRAQIRQLKKEMRKSETLRIRKEVGRKLKLTEN